MNCILNDMKFAVTCDYNFYLDEFLVISISHVDDFEQRVLHQCKYAMER